MSAVFAPRTAAAAIALAAIGLLAACSSTPDSIVKGPVTAPPTPLPVNIERVANGAIFQPHMTGASLYSSERPPRAVGDTLKVDIDESLSASLKLKTDNSRETALVQKGPGGSGSGAGLVDKLMNLDASANGTDTLKGKGETENNNSFKGRIAASVINVLPNGNLVVAGERSIAFNGGANTLRFSGIVNPRDIKPGNLVASSDVVNAKMELAGRGETSEAATRSWLQRVMSKTLSVW